LTRTGQGWGGGHGGATSTTAGFSTAVLFSILSVSTLSVHSHRVTRRPTFESALPTLLVTYDLISGVNCQVQGYLAHEKEPPP